MQRNKDYQHIGQGERLDTVEGHNDLYYDEEDEEGKNDFDQMASDDDSEDENPDAEILGLVGDGLGSSKKKKAKNQSSQEKIEVNLDDIEDEEDQECLLDYK